MAEPAKTQNAPAKRIVADPMVRIQTAIERIILYSRYILIVFYMGLAFALGVYAISFIFEVVHVAELALKPAIAPASNSPSSQVPLPRLSPRHPVRTPPWPRLRRRRPVRRPSRRP